MFHIVPLCLLSAREIVGITVGTQSHANTAVYQQIGFGGLRPPRIAHRYLVHVTTATALKRSPQPWVKFQSAGGSIFGRRQQHASELCADPARIVVDGGIAGGNLAAVVTLRSKAAGGPAIALQVLANPVTEQANELPITLPLWQRLCTRA